MFLTLKLMFVLALRFRYRQRILHLFSRCRWRLICG
ncbi:unnamed protein product [Acanthoscelides obtectus]|uniref:Uncharacterized protein n=1 Tax=Acanthoscelides obtectus TaxID=200917 RepID=A0A9P0L349_ACAOB|nr:unnamed protein product [Acanthoscelides obtectus]CAK1671534.1 hypothetical protein AOBTE_LOCUS28303 [Acanthoscelides obtectus]